MKSIRKLLLCVMLALCAALLVAQSVDEVNIITKELSDKKWEKGELDRQLGEIDSSIESEVNKFLDNEQKRKEGELDKDKGILSPDDYQSLLNQYYEDARQDAEKKREKLKSEKEGEKEEKQNKIADLNSDIGDIQTTLGKTTYSIHISDIPINQDKDYDPDKKIITMRIKVNEFEETYDVQYSLPIKDKTLKEILEFVKTELNRNYMADVYFGIKIKDDNNYYVRVSSITVYHTDGDVVVQNYQINKDGKEFLAGNLFSSSGTAATTTETTTGTPTVASTTPTEKNSAASPATTQTENKPTVTPATTPANQNTPSVASTTTPSTQPSKQSNTNTSNNTPSNQNKPSPSNSPASTSSSGSKNIHTLGGYVLLNGVEWRREDDTFGISGFSIYGMWAEFNKKRTDTSFVAMIGSSYSYYGKGMEKGSFSYHSIEIGSGYIGWYPGDGIGLYSGIGIGMVVSNDEYVTAGVTQNSSGTNFLFSIHPILCEIRCNDWCNFWVRYDIEIMPSGIPLARHIIKAGIGVSLF